MATNVTRIMPANPAQMALLAHLHSFPRDKLERTIEALIAIVDLIDGDTETEDSETGSSTVDERGHELTPYEDLQPQDDEDREHTGDEQDMSWTEWHGRGRRQRSAMSETVGSIHDEDDEEDDHAEDDDPDSEHDGSEPGGDDEDRQMEQDVPCIPVHALEPNIFNGQRQLLGYTLPRPTRDGMEPEL